MKQFFLFISILFAFNLSAQSTWNDVNEKVSTTPAPSYDSTFVLEAQSRAGIATGQANWVPASSGGASYLVYTALLTQTGTDAPVATVLDNTLGVTPSYTYVGDGLYTIECSSCFTLNKTFPITMQINYGGGGNNLFDFTIYRQSSSIYYLQINSGEEGNNGKLVGHPIEIRVYP